MTAAGGEGSDGRGTPGSDKEKSREARAGETGTTRFGMEDGADTLTDTPGSDDAAATDKGKREGSKQ